MTRSDSGNPRQPSVLLSYGFRPFFLLAGLYGASAIALWAAAYSGVAPLPSPLAPTLWHGHEMLFGFATAAAAGFLTTAVPAWTGTEPVRGAPLALLVVLWGIGRLVFWLGDLMPPWLAAAGDLLLLPALAVTVGIPIVRSGKRRNLAVPFLLLLLLTGNGLFHAELLGLTGDTANLGLRLGTYGFVLMTALILGRITPAFTASALRDDDATVTVETPSWAERIARVAVLAAVAAAFDESAATVSGLLALIAAVALALRMRHWQTRQALRAPLLWTLHLAHIWLIIGFVALALTAWTEAVPADVSLHAFTTGAMGTAILAIMTRAGLGHTGRPLVPSPLTVAAFVMVSLAAIIRVAGPLTAPAASVAWAAGAGLLWSLAFVAFCVVFTPILVSPRPDGNPG